MSYSTPHKGIFSKVKQRLRRNRLGELLVQNGSLSSDQLKYALATSQKSGQQLGSVLIAEKLVTKTDIRRTLIEQFMLRMIMTAIALFITFGSMGFTKNARGAEIQDATARISLVQESFQKASYHPKLFGSTEKRSTSLKAFTKWTGMFERFNASLNNLSAPKEIIELKASLNSMKGLPLPQMATKVNALMNTKRYIEDKDNYGKSDYWATPIEFYRRGGDCEDFAIAKYTALRALGVPDDRMRIAIVQDQKKNIPHAILIVYTDNGAMILDNQIKKATKADKIRHYKPIFSINQSAWWLHTAPKANITRVASAAQ
ncbi:MAG: transglutaminase-like cysteine peptidase [Pseudomonadota bacterium]